MLKVRDHCHFTGQYRGAAHNSCNLKCRKPMIIPVIFHNLQGYDAHLFIKELSKIPGELNCIPSTEEKYISLNLGDFIPQNPLILLLCGILSIIFHFFFI